MRCGHSLCTACHQRLLNANEAPQCPLCREPIGEGGIRNYPLQMVIDDLDAKCKHCGYASIFRNVLDHCKTCDEVIVECLNATCEIKFPRKDLEIHNSRCPMAIISCNFCGREFPRQEMQEHQSNSCVGKIVGCNFGCSEHGITRLA